MIGSVPGVIIGSNLSVKGPQGALRYALGLILIAAGLTIMSKANTDLIPWVMVAASVGIVALFAIQIALRKEVEHDPDEQAELERLERLAQRAKARGEPVPAAAKD